VLRSLESMPMQGARTPWRSIMTSRM